MPLYDLGDVYCPRCGSYERHRALLYYLQQEDILASSGTILEIGCGMMLSARLYFESRGWTYSAVDCWAIPDTADVCGEASRLPLRDSYFDIVLCTHVLEHVEDEFGALSELRRVTKPSGLALIQVPFDDTVFATRENQLAVSGDARKGCHHHHRRDYGLDIRERLEFFFQRVDEIHPLQVIPECVAQRHGFQRNHGTTFFCGAGDQPRREYRGQLQRDLLPMKRLWLTQRAAYENYQARNGNGSALEDWIHAEARIGRCSDADISRRNVYEVLGTAVRGIAR
jgi:SAM-dependent methyltransferase